MYKIDLKYVYGLSKHPEYTDNLYNLYCYLCDPLGLANKENLLSKSNCLLEDISFLELYDDLIDQFNYYANLETYITNPLIIKMNTDEQLTLVHDFYKSTNTEIYNLFMKHFSKRKDHLYVHNKKLFSSYAGEAFVNPPTDDYFIALRKDKYLDFARNYSHECGHIVGQLLGNKEKPSEENPLFIEIESQFFEIIFLEYLLSFKGFENDAIFLKNEIVDTVSTDADDIIKKYILVKEAIKLINSGHLYTNRQIINKLPKNTGINRKERNYLLNFPAEYSFKYLFSYTYAFELFNIYKEDKEKALYLLKQACLNKTEDTYLKIDDFKKLGLNPASNIDSFTRTLKR